MDAGCHNRSHITPHFLSFAERKFYRPPPPTNPTYRYFNPFLHSTNILDRRSNPRLYRRKRSNSATTMPTMTTQLRLTIWKFMNSAGTHRLFVRSFYKIQIAHIMPCTRTELAVSEISFWKQARIGSERRVIIGLIRLFRSAPGISEWARHIWGEPVLWKKRISLTGRYYSFLGIDGSCH